jgi:chorismate mutase
MSCRGIRGAISVEKDERIEILNKTKFLLSSIFEANPGLLSQDIASILFSVTDDIISVYPAVSAREMGLTQVPLMCFKEIPVIGSLPYCIRVLIHWNTDKPQSEIRHVYLENAKALRPDLD